MTYYLVSTDDIGPDGRGSVRELTFDECELLHLDGTLRGDDQREQMIDVHIFGYLVATMYHTAGKFRLATMQFTPYAADPGSVGRPTYDVIASEGPLPPVLANADPNDSTMDNPVWQNITCYLEEGGTIEWRS